MPKNCKHIFLVHKCLHGCAKTRMEAAHPRRPHSAKLLPKTKGHDSRSQPINCFNSVEIVSTWNPLSLSEVASALLFARGRARTGNRRG